MAYCFIPLHLCHLFSLFGIFSPLFCLMEFKLNFKNHLLEGFPDILTPPHTTELINLPQAHYLRASLVAQMVKNLPAIQETWAWFLGQEDPLEKGMATHSSILAWRIPWTEEPGSLQSMGRKESDMTECHPLSIPCPVFYCWSVWAVCTWLVPQPTVSWVKEGKMSYLTFHPTPSSST